MINRLRLFILSRKDQTRKGGSYGKQKSVVPDKIGPCHSSLGPECHDCRGLRSHHNERLSLHLPGFGLDHASFFSQNEGTATLQPGQSHTWQTGLRPSGFSGDILGPQGWRNLQMTNCLGNNCGWFDRIHGHLLLDAELQNLQEDFGRPH